MTANETNTAAPGLGDAILEHEQFLAWHKAEYGYSSPESSMQKQRYDGWKAALAAQPAPVDDDENDVPVWHLIAVAERLGAVKEGDCWNLNIDTFYAIEKELHEAVNAHQYAQCEQPAPVVGGFVELLRLARSEYRDSDAAGDALDWLDEQAALLAARPGGDDDKILWGIVANAGRLSSRRTFRWAHVVDATGQGSTSSAGLCRRFGFDPDQQVGGDDDEAHPAQAGGVS